MKTTNMNTASMRAIEKSIGQTKMKITMINELRKTTKGITQIKIMTQIGIQMKQVIKFRNREKYNHEDEIHHSDEANEKSAR